MIGGKDVVRIKLVGFLVRMLFFFCIRRRNVLISDHYTFLGNFPHTPPLTQHLTRSENKSKNVGLGEG